MTNSDAKKIITLCRGAIMHNTSEKKRHNVALITCNVQAVTGCCCQKEKDTQSYVYAQKTKMCISFLINKNLGLIAGPKSPYYCIFLQKSHLQILY